MADRYPMPDLTARESFVKLRMEIAEDFSDGAFWGFMQENDIDVDEVVAVSKKCYVQEPTEDQTHE